MISYTIHSVREVPVGTIRRTEVAVVVAAGATHTDLVEVAEQVAQDRRSAAHYNALIIGFFDYEEFVGRAPYSLGSWEHAPKGQWGEARSALPDYANFEAADHLREKDWSQRPDHDAVRLWREWFEVLKQLDTDHGMGDHEAEAFRIVGQRNNLTPEHIKAACQRVTVWPYV